MSHKEIFTKIYSDNVWGGSGGGSTPEATELYRHYLKMFLKENHIKTVIDYGCGMWEFSQMIDWSGIDYLGIDCVQSVIDGNAKYKAENISFVCSDVLTGYADLLIVKDIFQHWSSQQIINFLEDQKNSFKFILITNTSDQRIDWQDTIPPNTRPLSARFEPLKSFKPQIVLETNINEPKETSLIWQ